MTEQLIKTISKYINSIYKPVKIGFRESYNYENNNIKKEFIIDLWFDEIDDKYLTNPNHSEPDKLKEKMLEREIRKDIKSFFNIETSGLDLDGFSPYRYKGLTIDVTLIKK